MLKMALTVIGALTLSACSVGFRQPTKSVIDKIESKLVKVDCIGSLDKWQRTYFFKRASGSSYPYTQQDTSVVKIEFAQSGFEEFRQGRRVVRFPDFPSIDDREYDLVFAEYEIKSEKLSISACGPNMD